MQGRHRRSAQGPIGNEFRRSRKRSAKKQIARRPRPSSANAGVSRPAPGPAPGNDRTDMPAREPMRCSFGAVRVGALLGRVRLHLQTDRFLAVHRGDALWEKGCREAALALAEIVSRMAEEEMDAALPSGQQIPQGRLTAPVHALFSGVALRARAECVEDSGAARPGQQGHGCTGRNACATQTGASDASDTGLERSEP